MKRKAITLLACVFAAVMALCLAGCGTSLDKEVTVQNMTVKVPSDWAESTTSYSSFGSNTYVSDDMESFISIGYDENYKTVEEQLNMNKSSIEMDPINGYDWYSTELGNETIESSIVQKYEIGYKFKDNDGNEHENINQVAFIMTPSMNFDITVHGNDIKLDDVLGTMQVA